MYGQFVRTERKKFTPHPITTQGVNANRPLAGRRFCCAKSTPCGRIKTRRAMCLFCHLSRQRKRPGFAVPDLHEDRQSEYSSSMLIRRCMSAIACQHACIHAWRFVTQCMYPNLDYFHPQCGRLQSGSAPFQENPSHPGIS